MVEGCKTLVFFVCGDVLGQNRRSFQRCEIFHHVPILHPEVQGSLQLYCSSWTAPWLDKVGDFAVVGLDFRDLGLGSFERDLCESTKDLQEAVK